MKTTNLLGLTLKTLTLAGFCFLFSPNVSAQTPSATDPFYILREYMKVEPGMGEQYLKTEVTWKKVHARRKTEEKIVDWVLYRRLFPSGTNSEYEYMTLTVFKTGKELEAATSMNWEYITKGMSADDLAIANNTEKTRKLVSRSLDQQMERVQPGPSGRFVKLTQVRAVAFQGGELAKHEHMMKPVFEEAVKMGKIAGWRFGSHVYPMDDNTGNYYRAINTNTLDEMLNNENNGYLQTAFKKVYPDKDYMTTMKTIRSSITTFPKEEIWERVDKLD